nr:hypothetical protein [Tanacetum cinerariifolium]
MDAVQELASLEANGFCDSPLLGVNTPRSDEDRLKLMELMVFLLQKGFWNTASVKRSDDVIRLQALVDKKKIVISDVVIRKILQLDDAEGVVCLLNEEIFAGLALMGYEKPRVRKGFSGVETPLFEGMLAARQPVEEGLAEAQVRADDAVSAAVEENVTEDVPHNAIPSPPSHDILSLSQEPSSPPQQPQSSPQAPPQGVDFPTHIQQVLDVCSALTRRVKNLEHDNAAQKLDIIKLQARVKRLERANKDVFNQGRMIDDMDTDKGIELVKDADIAKTEGRHAVEQAKKQAEIYNLDLDHSFKVLSMQEDDSEVQEVVEIITTAKLITDVVTATSQVSVASATISAAKPSIPAAVPTVVATYIRRRKGVIIRDPEEELSSKTPAETPRLKDKGKGILIETPKPMKKKDQIKLDAEYAKKLHEEINKDHEEFNKDIDWDAAIDPKTAGYKMDFFKGMTYAEICPNFQARFDENMSFLFKLREEIEEEDQEIIKSINETPTQKVAKRRKLGEEAQEAEDLKKHLEVVDEEDGDVFIEATPLARKVPVVDYQIVLVDNKPRFKIIKADETHQLYISFITLLKNFDREDLENL